jgi:UDP-N-acetylglucosamine 2-epimerase (non-hydrolysing)
MKRQRLKKKKICIVFGTRPEAIKLAPVIAEMRKHSDRIAARIVLTAQHRHLVDPILRYFKIRPDFDLDIMRRNQQPVDVAVRVCKKVDRICRDETPDLVVVQGDTTSAAAAAQAAFFRKIDVAHVEAGLRTADRYNPFPEEMNRRLITRLSAIHFAATPSNRRNLLNENVDKATIFVTGNPVIDALREILRRPMKKSTLPRGVRTIDPAQRMVLLTTHRRENFGEPQRNIFSAIRDILERYADVEVVFPVHPNPEVQKAVRSHLPEHPRLHLIQPVDYISFVRLMARAFLVMTDSGGIQEEAPALGKPVLVLRVATERGEILKSGNGILAGVDRESIVAEAARLLERPVVYRRFSKRRYPFGKGDASAAIVRHILKYLRA